MRTTDQNVKVENLDVHINVISVNGKAMTPVLFRQLPKKAFINRMNNSFRGIPWGRVNYFWGPCNSTHVHILWVDADQNLFRDCIYPTRSREQLTADKEWTALFEKMRALPQLYIDGDHSDVLA